MFEELRYGFNAFEVVEYAIVLIGRVNGVRIQPEAHQYCFGFQFLFKQRNNGNTSTTTGWDWIDSKGLLHRQSGGFIRN